MAPPRVGKTKSQKVGLLLGPVLFFIVLLIDIDPGNPVITRMAAVAVLMATWWITEAIPLGATALLPMILYPLLGILKGKATAPIYFNSTIFLFMGGFMIALTMEKWNLHKRIALLTIRLIGGGPPRIILGFMAASAFLSMWISNTACTIMMLPIGLAIILQIEERFDIRDTHPFSVCLMLGIAYASSMGGLATLVGTPPNLVLQRVFELTFPKAQPVSFGTWIIMAFPVTVVMTLIIWIMLTKVFFRFPAKLGVDPTIVEKEYKELGPMSFEEKTVSVCFAITAILWIFREKLQLGFVTLPGWSQLLPYPDFIDDGTVALCMASILFFIPTRGPKAGRSTVMDADASETYPVTVMGVDVFKGLPWDIIILFGGGFALAKGFQVTGLSAFIGQKLQVLAGIAPIYMIGIVCTSLTFLTELTSNTATTQMILPILGSLAVAIKSNPLLLMIPATLSASCAFMMPVATPPNAIVFGSGRVKIGEMVRVGIAINLIGIVIVTFMFYFLGTAVFSIDPAVFPEWARFIGKP
jgi:sodium-dependent dicarboxylate transporter 2/3/5